MPAATGFTDATSKDGCACADNPSARKAVSRRECIYEDLTTNCFVLVTAKGGDPPKLSLPDATSMPLLPELSAAPPWLPLSPVRIVRMPPPRPEFVSRDRILRP